MNSFEKLGLRQATAKALNQLGFKNPTPIQEQAIPLLLENNPTDLIGLAQTGTGKTAAFGLPLIELIDIDDESTQALIMAPTRELGQQTAQQLNGFSTGYGKLNIEVVYGGAAISNQIRALKKPTQIVVATPGRLLDLINRKAISLKNVRYVVLDEADEMLNMGFKQDIDQILSFTQKERVTWLFSATMPPEIRKIVDKYMTNPQEVSINTKEKVNKDIVHQYVVTTIKEKLDAVTRFLDSEPEFRGVMFCRTRRTTQKVAEELNRMGYKAEPLHGDLSQKQRDGVMRRFKNHKLTLLVATDVAARGIDVDDLTHVLHHQLPDQLESYTHRSGRTGRIGKKGISLAFINNREGKRIKEIEKKNKITFEQVQLPAGESRRVPQGNELAERINTATVNRKVEEAWHEIEPAVKNLSREELAKRLISLQLSGRSDNRRDSRREATTREERPRREERIEKPKTYDNNGYNRYYINIGEIDGVSKGELLQFMSDVSGVKRKAFGHLSLQKNCAYFDVDSNKDSGFAQKFNEYEINDRPIKVGRDEGNPAKSKKPPKHKGEKPPKYKSEKKSHRKGKRR